MESDALWQAVLAELELGLSKPNFAWFSKTRIESVSQVGDSQVVTIACPSSYAKDWIESHNVTLVQQLLEKISGIACNLVFIVGKTKVTRETGSAGPLFDEVPYFKPPEQLALKAQLNPLYTFDHFVVGPSNNLAYNASLAVVKATGRIHNPLYFYGGVGTGKTHLMHAIGNAVLAKQPDAHILYASCEQFTNDLIESLKTKTTEKFRAKYRKLDVLLIDDIQFISKSEYSQEEFFNTFNALYNVNHQIVIASDKLPEEIPKLAARLTSRFQGGVIVDMQVPDLETRIAILQTKTQEFEVSLSDDILRFIAETHRDNVRELEGALKRVIATTSLNPDVVTLDVVKKLLGAKRELRRRITPRQIIDAVSHQFSVSLRELTGTKRQHEIVVARQVAMYLLRSKLNLQYERIADLLGGKDHTTIMYGIGRVENNLENNVEFRGVIDEIIETLNQTQ